jgi:hypothetical protein
MNLIVEHIPQNHNEQSSHCRAQLAHSSRWHHPHTCRHWPPITIIIAPNDGIAAGFQSSLCRAAPTRPRRACCPVTGSARCAPGSQALWLTGRPTPRLRRIRSNVFSILTRTHHPHNTATSALARSVSQPVLIERTRKCRLISARLLSLAVTVRHSSNLVVSTALAPALGNHFRTAIGRVLTAASSQRTGCQKTVLLARRARRSSTTFCPAFAAMRAFVRRKLCGGSASGGAAAGAADRGSCSSRFFFTLGAASSLNEGSIFDLLLASAIFQKIELSTTARAVREAVLWFVFLSRSGTGMLPLISGSW